jgi:hypothetical protein
MTNTVSFDVNSMIKRLDAFEAVQVPFATSLAINNLAKQAKSDLQDEMRRKFNNPVPYTLNSIYIKSSTKSNLYAEVGLKEFAGKGNAAADYLLPQISGGPAYATRFQKGLRAKGILAPNEFARPTQSDKLRLNQYGNVTPGQYSQILYGLSAYRDSSSFTYRKNAKKKRAPVISAIKTSEAGIFRTRKLYPGIYLQSKRAIEDQESALFWIGKTPQYNGKYPFVDIGVGSVNRNFNKEFGRALARAIASAK